VRERTENILDGLAITIENQRNVRVAIKPENTSWYAKSQPSFTSSVEDFLSGKVFKQYKVNPDTPVEMNLGQRQIAWGTQEIEKLSKTLFSKLYHDPDHLAHVLEVAR
jgi:ABC-type molybdate transport system ATPase subunit